ncbi:MAG: hypothetical protein LBK99_17450, partial [Opitutaceae bacterium]|nr:hypothetical protein [Opitutaceae bacterium]
MRFGDVGASLAKPASDLTIEIRQFLSAWRGGRTPSPHNPRGPPAGGGGGAARAGGGGGGGG